MYNNDWKKEEEEKKQKNNNLWKVVKFDTVNLTNDDQSLSLYTF